METGAGKNSVLAVGSEMISQVRGHLDIAGHHHNKYYYFFLLLSFVPILCPLWSNKYTKRYTAGKLKQSMW